MFFRVTVLFLIPLAAVAGGVKPEPKKPDAFMYAGGLEISKEGFNLIIKHEVGGGAVYYNRYLKRLTYPGGRSGATGGIGYDFGWQSRAQIAKDWGEHVSSSVLRRLQSLSGIKGSASRRAIRKVGSIVIPWEVALKVYKQKTIPRFARLTRKAYPGIEQCHPHMQSTRLSWTFNRGSGISNTSSRDREKRSLRRDTPSNPERFPSHYRASKRIWVGKGLDGLLRRREDEARLDEAALNSG